MEGVVRSIESEGAIVDLGGATGVLRTYQISQKRITSADEVLSVGDKVKVRAAGVRARGRHRRAVDTGMGGHRDVGRKMGNTLGRPTGGVAQTAGR